MTPIRLIYWIALTTLLATALSASQVVTLRALPAAPAEAEGGPESIAGSYVYTNFAVSPDDCYRVHRSQTFCFQAISYTDDWDYVYYLWQRFPDDWVVENVYVQGTPYCTQGGTFGSFSWYRPPAALNEIQIAHVRYHANPSDVCSAYYCFEVTSGSTSPGLDYARVSWYWYSSGHGSPPFYPCSSDGYTPSGQPACDEMTTVPAYIYPCTEWVYLPVVTRVRP